MEPVVVSPDLFRTVRAVSAVIDPVVVVARDPRMDEPLALAAERMRSAAEAATTTTEVRAMYKRAGIDPTKTRPSSEALLRRVRKGEPLPRVNSFVDVINWCSLDTQLPFGLYDFDRVRGPVTLRLGRTGESYAGIRKDVVHVDGRLTLADDDGPFGNPTSDSARTMVTLATTRALVVIFAPAALDPAIGAHALALTLSRIAAFAAYDANPDATTP
jgi:DNA/RNA-binding domain of Phe-tRNA-synthetase-like protein